MKLNFFAKVYLAITDFRLYPYVVQKEKFRNALGYFLTFILLVSAILSVGVTAKILNWTNDFMLVYESKVEDFTIKDGVLDTAKDMDFEFDDVRVLTKENIGYEEFNIEDLADEDDELIFLALKDSFLITNPNLGLVGFEYGDIGIDTNKQSLHAVLNSALENSSFKLSLTVAIVCGVFVAYLFTKFLNVIGISIMLLFLGYVFRTKYKFKHYVEVAFYVITLPVITEIIALLVTGGINEYASITYFLLTYVYMYYAIRALKLDNIIMATQQKIMGMKIDEQASIFDKEIKQDETNSEETKEPENNNEDNKHEKENDSENK